MGLDTMTRQDRYDLGALADFMAEDILSTPGRHLVDEVTEDCGDPEAFASAFEQIVHAELPSRSNAAGLSFTPGQYHAFPGSESGAWVLVRKRREAPLSSEPLLSRWRRGNITYSGSAGGEAKNNTSGPGSAGGEAKFRPIHAGMKILVVDDHELIREAMRGALAELDGEAAILEAADSREAMRLIEEHPDLDLILLDLNLPDRDGFTVLSELRKSHPAISVVVMSAQQDHDSVVKALSQGALGFIPKSATREVILRAMQLVFSGGVYIPAAGQEKAPQRDGPALLAFGQD